MTAATEQAVMALPQETEDGSPVWFDRDSSERVLKFLSLLCHTKGKWAGQPFKVLPWEREAVEGFYGPQTEDDDGEPVRFRQYLYEEIPKKNGKSELAAGLGLYHLLADGEQSPEVYLCAADRSNAGIVYDACKYMVEHTPALCQPESDPILWAVDSRKEIHCKFGGFLKILSAEAYSKHGYSPSCVIFDELHAQPSRDLWDVMTGAAGSARRQPVWIVLTTAGDDPDRKSIGWEIHEKCRRILSLRRGAPESEEDRDDPLWLPIMYGMSVETGDDPDRCAEIDIWDEEVWRRYNPSIGTTISLRTLRNEARAAKQSEALERLFRWLRLNQWIAVKSVGWVPLTVYDKTEWHGSVEDLRGMRCYGGVDLSSTTDLTAFTLVFPPQKGLDTWVTLFRAWTPDDDIKGRENRDHVPYRKWAQSKFIHLCHGDMIDYDDVEETVRGASIMFDIAVLGVDPYLSRTITQRLSADWTDDVGIWHKGLLCIEISQAMMGMSPPMKELERLIRSRKMLHEHNSAARWCFGNVRCYVDGNENMKPMKNKSMGRIDMTVAWIIAFAAGMAAPKPTLADAVGNEGYSM